MNLERLTGVGFVGELLGERLNDVTKTVLEGFVHLSEVSLLVKRILHLLHPPRELVLQIAKSVFQVRNSLRELSESFLRDATAGGFRNLEVVEGMLKSLELLLQRRHASFKILKVSVLEVLEFGTKSVLFVLKTLETVSDLLGQH